MTADVGTHFDDDEILFALLDGHSYKTAAETVGCSKRTVERRMADPEFRARYTEAATAAREERRAARVDRLAFAEERADDTLIELLDAESPMCRLKAALSIKELLARDRDRSEVLGRLAKLEVALGLSEEPS